MSHEQVTRIFYNNAALGDVPLRLGILIPPDKVFNGYPDAVTQFISSLIPIAYASAQRIEPWV